MVNENEIRDVENKLEVRENGMIVVQVGLLVTLYFRGSRDPQVRDSVIQCIERYRTSTADTLRWVADPVTGRFRKIENSREKGAEDWIRGLSPGREWALHYRGGADAGQANAFSVEVLGSQDYGKNELSYFRATLPMTFFATHEGSFSNLVLEFCRIIRPDQGYGGLGILESPYPRIRAKHEPIVFEIAKRFPGLEVDYPTSHAIWLRQEDGIKGGNWLTILGDSWIEKLGGINELRSKLTGDFIISEYPGGVLIQAGSRPQMGDLEKGVILEAYARLAAVLKPIRIKHHRMFQHPGKDRFDKVASEAWLARFDGAPGL